MEGDRLLHVLHEEQLAADLQRSSAQTESNPEHGVLWKNSPLPRQVLPFFREVTIERSAFLNKF